MSGSTGTPDPWCTTSRMRFSSRSAGSTAFAGRGRRSTSSAADDFASSDQHHQGLALRTRALAVPIFLWVSVMAVQTHGQMGCSDSRWSIPTAVSLVDEGNFDLDEFGPILQARGPAFLEQVGDHRYTVYP